MRRVLVLSVALVLATAGIVTAQSRMSNPASNKAFFGQNTAGVTIASVDGGDSTDITVIDITDALKTSSNGAVSATVSMETALWTYNTTTAIVNGGKSSSSSRATIRVWVEIDGVAMQPGEVVFADRLQATGLTANLLCGTNTADVTCTITGDITLELFQQTKEAASFTFFLGPLGSGLHDVKVKAAGEIDCRGSEGNPITCPTGILAGYDTKTMAAIGKATVLVEEQQNWGSSGN